MYEILDILTSFTFTTNISSHQIFHRLTLPAHFFSTLSKSQVPQQTMMMFAVGCRCCVILNDVMMTELLTSGREREGEGEGPGGRACQSTHAGQAMSILKLFFPILRRIARREINCLLSPLSSLSLPLTGEESRRTDRHMSKRVDTQAGRQANIVSQRRKKLSEISISPTTSPFFPTHP